MPPVQILVIAAAAAALWWGGAKVEHGLKKLAVKTHHAMVRVVHPKKVEPKK